MPKNFQIICYTGSRSQKARQYGSRSEPASQDFQNPNFPLTVFGQDYLARTDQFVAAKVLPVIPVTKDTGKFYKQGETLAHNDVAQHRGRLSESSGGGFGLSSANFTALEYAHHIDVPWQDLGNNETPFDLLATAAKASVNAVALRREIEFVSKFLAASQFTVADRAGNASPTGTQFKFWSDASSTPIIDIATQRTAVQKISGVRPNVMVLTPEVRDALLNHPDIVAKKLYAANPPDKVTLEMLAATLDLEKVFVVEAMKNTAAQGQTESLDFVASKSASLLYIDYSAQSRLSSTALSTGKIFQVVNQDAYEEARKIIGSPEAAAMGIGVYRIELPQIKATRIEAESYLAIEKTGARLGAHFLTAVA